MQPATPTSVTVVTVRPTAAAMAAASRATGWSAVPAAATTTENPMGAAGRQTSRRAGAS
ncbi:hypothetical protein [Lentzea roselyniae]|uniref:hypothetical protein n=1 Tax=Lentzea roselyniae TaxID=531940 RepID=UPI0031F97CCB